MKLRFKVDQKNAFRRGINAATSIVDLDVDPAILLQEERDLIADNLKSGIEVHNPAFPGWIIEAQGPELGDLLIAMRAAKAEHEKNEANAKAAREANARDREKEIAEASAKFAARQTTSHLGTTDVNGTLVSYSYKSPDFQTKNWASQIPGCWEWIKELEQQADVAKEEAVKEFITARTNAVARMAARLGWSDLVSKGYLTYNGLVKAIQAQALAKYGLTCPGFSQHLYSGAVDLTKEEIKACEAWRAKLPANAIVELRSSREDDLVVLEATFEDEGVGVTARLIVRDEREDNEGDDE